jgi:hypothetical protein
VHGPNLAHGFGLSARRPAGCCGLTPEGTAQLQLGSAGSTSHRARAGATGRNHRGRKQHGGAGGHGRRLVCCRVGGEGMKAVGEVRRARRSEAGLTQIATRRWGSGVARRGGGRLR